MAEKETNIVIVPDISAVELTALAKRDLKLRYLDEYYAKWDYYRSYDGEPVEGRGQKFEVLIWKPWPGYREIISSKAVCTYFQELGYSGHVGAFTEWRRQNFSLSGHHASIPDDRACYLDECGRIFIPGSFFDDSNKSRGLQTC